MPAERHEHFDADDNLTGYTVVYREPEWTDDDVQQLRELAEFEGGVGPCGYHHSLTTDKANHFTFPDEFCPVCAGLTQYSRRRAAQEQQAHKDAPPEQALPSDGRRTFVRLMSPAEVNEARGRLPG